MTTTRRFCCADLFKFNNVNLDVLTETVRLRCGPLVCLLCSRRAVCCVWRQYHMGFYLEYLAKWPDYFVAQEAPCGRLMGYSACTCGWCVHWLG